MSALTIDIIQAGLSTLSGANKRLRGPPADALEISGAEEQGTREALTSQSSHSLVRVGVESVICIFTELQTEDKERVSRDGLSDPARSSANGRPRAARSSSRRDGTLPLWFRFIFDSTSHISTA